MQYFIVMIDRGKSGFEAIVHPEDTRRQIIEEVRGIIASDTLTLVHVKFVDGNYIDDVTSEICLEAGEPDAPLSPVDRQTIAFDHARDHRKHSERV